MRALNVTLGSLVDGLLWPFHAWPPLVGLTVISLIVALLLLAAFKLTSNQRALAAARRRIQACMFELRLFQDDPQTIFRVIGTLARHQLTYLRYALVPWLWLGLPIALLLAHLHAQFGYDGLRPGQTAIVTVRLKPATAVASPSLRIEAPDGLRVETPGVWARPLREKAWRIAATRDGDYDLRVSLNGEAVTKRVRVSSAVVSRAAVRPAASVVEQWRYPAEAPLPADSAIEAIAVGYSPRAIGVLGFTLPWLAIFLVLSGLFALAFRPFFKIVF
jgi:hypothetical protein